jgi:hypothetical protein
MEECQNAIEDIIDKQVESSRMKALIDSWAIALGIDDWDIRTERIDPMQIEYSGEDYFIGIERDFEGRKCCHLPRHTVGRGEL